ncbi:MAG TPA: hypothetical protein PK760_09520 [Flavobacteriales bacterium]|nr:hypothetical protein [Flavobacteriales bacterium]
MSPLPYRIGIAALVGTAVYFCVGWLVFEALLGDYMSENTTQLVGFKKTEEEASVLLLLVSCTAYAALLAIVFDRITSVRSFGKGMPWGAIIGVLVAVMTDSYWYASSHFFNSFVPLLADVAAAGITVGIMGGAIGWTLGKLQ